MAKNDFKVFATGDDANVLSQVDYEALAARSSGFQSGIAKSAQLNKVWRQSSIMAAVLAQFITDQTGLDAIDDGGTGELGANLKAAIFNNSVLKGMPMAPTPAQFDNSTKLATMAALMRDRFGFSHITHYDSNVTLPSAAFGSVIACANGIDPYTLTLPALSQSMSGSAIKFISYSNGVTVSSGSATKIWFGMHGNASGTSITLQNGDSATLATDGQAWFLIDGSVLLPATKFFDASLTPGGYQRLPSGLIIQWGYLAVPPISTVDIILPIVYKAANLGVACAVDDIAANGSLYRWTVGNRLLGKITAVNNWNGNWIGGSWISWGY
ncbi:gp53-like domain-containing protein [Burkholderia plantarii]|uniref:gp53-like domain-containing protein n=1 Tax=Burkholderia plantarii TaxID=41899 RepID=UPI000A8E131C|nr:hypothetical protein [Burkholderia plantarii]